ncbi:hypothetical protein SAMD00019534_055100 [Acytostelium subglobosum LB1]|uniref:hypothetical protein n=1 Tax=Acytostelium subglobosum LB1 TaxID=1410327 RepID=UPI0006450CC5|nr:hypothetical protein SAMD00019534_055100 [Acytostelium subglobosum LB1]GAM22335.1 hypothetical protein SAMD00019534_055100 [Acytostelium subglobosum LB1]|eukprot:XP_012754455.1 hypothetical protein SAMD00019534_055100 [Acytostelium subglobosum LB1]
MFGCPPDQSSTSLPFNDILVSNSSTFNLTGICSFECNLNVSSGSKLIFDGQIFIYSQAIFNVDSDCTVEFIDPMPFPYSIPMLYLNATSFLFNGQAIVTFSQDHPIRERYEIFEFNLRSIETRTTLALPNKVSTPSLSFPTKFREDYTINSPTSATISSTLSVSGPGSTVTVVFFDTMDSSSVISIDNGAAVTVNQGSENILGSIIIGPGLQSSAPHSILTANRAAVVTQSGSNTVTLSPSTIMPQVTFNLVSVTNINLNHTGNLNNLVISNQNPSYYIDVYLSAQPKSDQQMGSLVMTMTDSVRLHLRGKISVGGIKQLGCDTMSSITSSVVVDSGSSITMNQLSSCGNVTVTGASTLNLESPTVPTAISSQEILVQDSSTFNLNGLFTLQSNVNITTGSKMMVAGKTFMYDDSWNYMTLSVDASSKIEFRDPKPAPYSMPLLTFNASRFLFYGEADVTFSDAHPTNQLYEIFAYYLPAAVSPFILNLPSKVSSSSMSFPTKMREDYVINSLTSSTLFVEVYGLSLGAVIGIIVGCSMFVVIVIAGVGFYVYRSRKNKQGYALINIEDDQ